MQISTSVGSGDACFDLPDVTDLTHGSWLTTEQSSIVRLVITRYQVSSFIIHRCRTTATDYNTGYK